MTSPQQKMPMDYMTGLPLPLIHQPGELPDERIVPLATIPRHSDRHHAFFTEAAFIRDESLRALRESRVQLVPRWAHDHLHEQVLPTPAPEDPFGRFRTLVFAAADYMPARGVAVPAKDVLELVWLSPERRTELSGIRGVHIAGPDRVKHELLRYVITHGLAVGRQQIDEFLHAPDPVVKAVLGGEIIRVASEEATIRLRDSYDLARDRRRLPTKVSREVGHYVFTLLAKNLRGEPDLQVVSWLGDLLAAA